MLPLLQNNVVLWFLLAISITSLSLILEKLITFSRIKAGYEDEKLGKTVANIISEVFQPTSPAPVTSKPNTETNTKLQNEKISQARILCLKAEPKTLSADTLRYLLENNTLPYQFLREYSAREIERKLVILEKYIFLLGTFSAIAPLLGLLGTVLGMMLAFASFTSSTNNDSVLLSRGIAEALITTAAGLIIAIPNLFFYNYFTRKIDIYRTALNLSTSEVIETLKKDEFRQ